MFQPVNNSEEKMTRRQKRNNNFFVVFDMGTVGLPIGVVPGRDAKQALKNARRKWPGSDFNPMIRAWDDVSEEIRTIALAINPRAPQAH